MGQSKEQKRQDAIARQLEYDKLTTQQKFERAGGKKERERLAKRLAEERKSAK